MSSSDLLKPAAASSDFLITADDLFRMKEKFLSSQKFFELTGGLTVPDYLTAQER
jgi:hypothetical protein